MLYVKRSPPTVDAIIKDAADFSDELQRDLERMARDYAGARIESGIKSRQRQANLQSPSGMPTASSRLPREY
jgi:vacuolar-type H+-ATPase subunit D/Vma8